MKKNILSVLFIGLYLLCSQVISYASLNDMSDATGHVVYDDVKDQYWIWDLSFFSGPLFYSEKLDIIQGLCDNAYYGLNSWHLATTQEINLLWTYDYLTIADSFNPSYTSTTPFGETNTDWYGIYDEIYPTSGAVAPAHKAAYVIQYIIPDYDTGWQSSLEGAIEDDAYSIYAGAWVTSAGVTPVPEPAGMLLFGYGLIGFAVSKKRKQSQAA